MGSLKVSSLQSHALNMRTPDDLTLADLRDLSDLTVLIAAASEAGVLQSLAQAPADVDGLAERMGFDRRAVRITLLALQEAGLLQRDGDLFTPTARCRAELCDPASPEYVAGGLPLWLRSIRAWTRLGEVLERGGPLEKRPEARSPEDAARFMAGMAAAPRERVERLVDICLARHPDAGSVLDVGGGPGHMTRAFVDRGLRGTLYDTGEIISHVEDAYDLTGVDGLTTVTGDFTRDPLPAGPFDLVLVSNVMHIYGPDTNRALAAKAASVTPSGGVIAVAEFLRGRSRKAARFGVQMLLKTDEGDAYAEDDIAGWLQEAGFEDPQVADLDPDRQVVTAVRR